MHKPAHRQFTWNHTYVARINAQWQADLVDMQGIARQNGGIHMQPSHRDWCFFHVRISGVGPFQRRQGNHSGSLASAHNRKPTQL